MQVEKTKIHNSLLLWTLFAIIAVLELILFKSYVLNNIISFYPRNFDQSYYLPVTYNTYEHIKQEGFFAGLHHSPLLATGILFPIQAAVLFLLFSPSRLVALYPNVIYYIILQLSALIALRTLTNKKYLFFMCLGLILAIKTPFYSSGDLMDYRIDFMAFCIYGTVISFIITSRFFLEKKWLFIAGFFTILLILLRAITIIYFMGLLTCTFAYLLFTLLRTKQTTEDYLANKKRLLNLSIFFLITAMISAIYIWDNRTGLYNYYMVGHVLGNEKTVRAYQAGTTNILLSLIYYPKSLIFDHVGIDRCVILFFMIWIFLFKPVVADNHLYMKLKLTYPKIGSYWLLGLVFISLALLIPLVALTADVSKSPIVGSIMLMPFLWLVIGFTVYSDKTFEKSKAVKIFINIFADFVFIVGLGNQIHHYRLHKTDMQVKDLTTISSMYQDIGNYAENHHWPVITLSVDQVCDYLTLGSIETIYYEKYRKMLNVQVDKVGGSVFAVNQNDLIADLAKSNVVILNLNDYPDELKPLPINLSLNNLKPVMKAYADAHFTPLKDYHFLHSTFRVYVAKDNTSFS